MAGNVPAILRLIACPTVEGGGCQQPGIAILLTHNDIEDRMYDHARHQTSALSTKPTRKNTKQECTTYREQHRSHRCTQAQGAYVHSSEKQGRD